MQHLRHLGGTARVEHVLLRQPAAPGHVDAVAVQRQLVAVVGVGIDDQLDAQGPGTLAVDPVEVEAIRGGR